MLHRHGPRVVLSLEQALAFLLKTNLDVVGMYVVVVRMDWSLTLK